jgi:poly-gamma-glutamate capsule biosynthesis protein CapA/YwtB (metallophosphatase superfamily)
LLVPKQSLILLACICVLPLSAKTQDTLSLLFAGDVMGHTPQIKAAQTGANSYDYGHCFAHIAPIVSSYDLAVANLEVTLPGIPPYTGYPMFRSPKALAESLKDAGFDMLVTANNHSADGRLVGVTGTLDALDSLGLMHTGTFRNKSERQSLYPLLFYRKGIKIALLNYTYDLNGMPIPPPTAINLIDTLQIGEDLALAASVKPDYTIVVMHWGLEYQTKESPEQRRQANFILRHGADIIIASHPHVVQPIKEETVTLPDGQTKTGLVVYSMGNFISNQNKPETDGGIFFTMKLTKAPNQAKAQLVETGYIPIWRYIKNPTSAKPRYLVIPDTKEARTVVDTASQAKMDGYFEKIRRRLANITEIRY